jgi:hypothetical protein
MPKYEQALQKLPLDELLAELCGSGISAQQLLRRLEEKGVDRETAKLVIQAQIDAGQVTLGEGMKLVLATQPEAA